MSISSQAQEIRDMAVFGRLPILHEGRIKPLSSFADILCARWRDAARCSSSYLLHTSSLDQLAELVFNPAQAEDLPIFAINDRRTLELLKLQGQQLYSLAEINQALQPYKDELLPLRAQDPQQVGQPFKKLLLLQDHVAQVVNVMRSMTLYLPIVQQDDHGIENKNYAALVSQNPRALKNSRVLQDIREGGKHSDLLRVFPVNWNSIDGNWLSPWVFYAQQTDAEPQASRDYRDAWLAMAAAYRENDEHKWQSATRRAYDLISLKSDVSSRQFRLWLEPIYLTVSPYFWAAIAYVLAAVCSILSLRYLQFKFAASLVLISGLVMHAAGIASRVVILDRPPVGTLYESVLFVAWVCAVLGMLSRVEKAQAYVRAAGGLSASVLLFIAPVLIQDAESLDHLGAVLNTNFWLMVHVLVITAGYSLCIMCAVCAHIVLLHPEHKFIARTMHSMSVVALLFTTTGTILGGIWADQSWGRFWGWDPKENGALLIILWLVWLQHASVARQISPLQFAAGLAMTNVIVALAWFGVNLLGIGLHSYGFISGIAYGLAVFCSVQTMLIIFLFVRARRLSQLSGFSR
jgi:ABC-type transport system involved in cytochrome c biogenesis permease subunit